MRPEIAQYRRKSRDHWSHITMDTWQSAHRSAKHSHVRDWLASTAFYFFQLVGAVFHFLSYLVFSLSIKHSLYVACGEAFLWSPGRVVTTTLTSIHNCYPWLHCHVSALSPRPELKLLFGHRSAVHSVQRKLKTARTLLGSHITHHITQQTVPPRPEIWSRIPFINTYHGIWNYPVTR